LGIFKPVTQSPAMQAQRIQAGYKNRKRVQAFFVLENPGPAAFDRSDTTGTGENNSTRGRGLVDFHLPRSITLQAGQKAVPPV